MPFWLIYSPAFICQKMSLFPTGCKKMNTTTARSAITAIAQDIRISLSMFSKYHESTVSTTHFLFVFDNKYQVLIVKPMRTFIGFVIIIFLAMPALAGNEPSSRYFFSGDGEIHLKGAKSGVSFKGRYRNPDGTHDDAALRQIHQAFSAKYGDPISKISPRFIEFLDYLEDRFNKGARITIVSGYRSPTYNTDLRNKGKLAAKASMHQYGMAADIRMQGVNPRDIWNYVKDLKFGGTGFYQGANVHVDVGPARFWDQTSSKVGTGIADDNKLIEIVADKDIYRPGEEMKMRFIRMTLFPIGVKSEFILEKKDKMDKWKKTKDFILSFSHDLSPRKNLKILNRPLQYYPINRVPFLPISERC